MPATMSTEITPKSVLRHRTIGVDQNVPAQPLASRTSRSKRSVKQAETIPCWKSAPDAASRGTQQKDMRWLITLGSGMLIALLLIVVGQFFLSWLGTLQDDLRYGYPRTFQTDAFVGHEKTNQPSHFIAMNLRGQIEVIELPGGDVAHARIFVGPQLYGPGSDLLPVTVQFVASTQQAYTGHASHVSKYQPHVSKYPGNICGNAITM